MKRPSGNWGSHPTQQTEYRGGGAVPNAPKVDEHDLRVFGVPTPHNGLNTERGNNLQRRGGAGSPQHYRRPLHFLFSAGAIVLFLAVKKVVDKLGVQAERAPREGVVLRWRRLYY